MKTSRFTVKTRVNINRSPKFGLNNEILQRKKHSLKNRENQVSPRNETLRRYNMRRPIGDDDKPNTPRQHGRFRVTDIENNPRRFMSNNFVRRNKFGLNNEILKGRKRMLKHSHRSQSPRRATLRRYNMRRQPNDYDIINTPRQRGRFLVKDIEPLHRPPVSPKLTMKQAGQEDHVVHMTKNGYILNMYNEGERIRRSSSSTSQKRKSRK